VFLVLDATTGQNAVQQMKLFRDALEVTGVVLTKLDGTAKGGVVLGVVEQHRVPVRFIGLGERVEDLREFDAQAFVEALFAKPAEATLAA
jgi:fused signal recognition particle receptor